MIVFGASSLVVNPETYELEIEGRSLKYTVTVRNFPEIQNPLY